MNFVTRREATFVVQNAYFIPSWMIRGVPACVVMRPNCPELILAIVPPAAWSVPGSPQLNVLNRLNVSSRSSSVCSAATPTWRDIARSTLQK